MVSGSRYDKISSIVSSCFSIVAGIALCFTPFAGLGASMIVYRYESAHFGVVVSRFKEIQAGLVKIALSVLS